MMKSGEYDNLLYFCTDQIDENYIGMPFISGKLLLFFCMEGHLSLSADSTNYDVHPQHMFVIHPHAEMVVNSVSSDFKGFFMGFMMQLQDNALQQLDPMFFSTIFKQHLWHLEEKVWKAAISFCQVFDYLCNELESTQKTYMISNVFAVFLQVFQANTLHLFQHKEEKKSYSGRNILENFFLYLHTDYKSCHEVSHYANKLCVSPKYLTMIVKNSLGTTPKELINRRLASESLYLLGKTSLSIQEIGLLLGFSNQSYFGRFFKRMFDVSPIHFRKNPNLDFMIKLDEKKVSRLP